MTEINKKWYHWGPFTIFDLETTGMSPVNDRIIEIAAIRIEGNGEENSFYSLVNPEKSIPKEAVKIHGITNDVVAPYPKFRKIGQKFLNFIKNSQLIAHNAKFDLAFLQESLARENLQLWDGKTLDSITIIKQAYPGLKSYSLQNLQRTFGLMNKGQAHRAYSDMEITKKLFAKAMECLIS